MKKNLYGKELEEYKKRCAERKAVDPEYAAYCEGRRKNARPGTIWITDGVLSTKIGIGEEIPKGWYRGRGDNPKLKIGLLSAPTSRRGPCPEALKKYLEKLPDDYKPERTKRGGNDLQKTKYWKDLMEKEELEREKRIEEKYGLQV